MTVVPRSNKFGIWGTVDSFNSLESRGYVTADRTGDKILLRADKLQEVGYTSVLPGTRLRFSVRCRDGVRFVRRIFAVNGEPTKFAH